MKGIVKLLLVLLVIVCLSLGACTSAAGETTPAAQKQTIKIGCVSATKPVVDIMKEAMAGTDYDIEIVVFDGNNLPAEALNAGDIDGLWCNSLKWMTAFNDKNQANLAMSFSYFYSYQGLYSKKWKSVNEFPDGARIVIPQGLPNVDQALKILQAAGLLTLDDTPSESGYYTIIDLAENPRDLKLLESELTTAMSSIDDVDAVVASAVIVRDSGKMSASDHLAISVRENISPMGLIIQQTDADAEWVKLAEEKMNAQHCYDEFNTKFEGTFILESEIDSYFP